MAWNDTHRGLYPTEEGPGRADAFGRIANATFGDAISPANYRIADAPVDYPQLWDMWTFDWVQWNGSAQQPMARNIGEALGVGATLNFFDANGQPLQGDARYASSVRVRDLHKIEETLQKLQPPAWPEALFGAVDKPLGGQRTRAVRRKLRRLPRAAQDSGRRALGAALAHAAGRRHRHRPERRQQHRQPPLRPDGPAMGPERTGKNGRQTAPDARGAAGSESVVGGQGPGVRHRLRRRPCLSRGQVTPEEKPRLDGFGLPIGVREKVAYKARPLAGVWATAPFLHNGSVPSLYQLLSPQDERATTFYKGTFEYDPRHLGYRTEAFTNGFLFDTRISGNHNSGHEFRAGERGNGVIGRLLLPEERWALLEYLKVLGGPLEAQLP